jgi:hypothetical protein
MSNKATQKYIKYGSVSFSLGGLKALMLDLSDIVSEQGEIELAQTKRRDDQTEVDYEDFLAMARTDIFKILATINYSDGSSIHTSDPSDIEFEPEGHLIESIYVSNVTPYKQNAGVEPLHYFHFFLDFSQPPLLDAAQLISSPTANNTHLNIQGRRSGWRTAIEDAVNKRIKKKRHIRNLFHKGFVYDFGLFFLGLPASIYACWYASQFIQQHLGNLNVVVTTAAYLYVGFCALWIYRLLFSYTKWAFPLVELTDQSTRPRFHRGIWWGIVCVIAGKLFWDLADPYVSLPVWWKTLNP